MSQCKIGSLDPDATELYASLEALGAGIVAKQLTDAGHPVGPTTVKDHRARRCACTRQVDVDAIVAPPTDVPEVTRQARTQPPSGWSPRAGCVAAACAMKWAPAWTVWRPACACGIRSTWAGWAATTRACAPPSTDRSSACCAR